MQNQWLQTVNSLSTTCKEIIIWEKGRQLLKTYFHWYHGMFFSRQTNNSLANFCRGLFISQERNASVHCKRCKANLIIFNSDQAILSYVPIDHACAHLGKMSYECRQCDYKSPNRSAMTRHITKAHKLKGRKDYCNDLTSDFQEDIKAMLLRCFGNASE